MKETLNTFYKNPDGNVYSFSDVLSYFDGLVHQGKKEVSLRFSPAEKIIVVTVQDEPVFTEVFREIEEDE